jgi:hypothetical protein
MRDGFDRLRPYVLGWLRGFVEAGLLVSFCSPVSLAEVTLGGTDDRGLSPDELLWMAELSSGGDTAWSVG